MLSEDNQNAGMQNDKYAFRSHESPEYGSCAWHAERGANTRRQDRPKRPSPALSGARVGVAIANKYLSEGFGE
jgi:hypothetical protein